MSKDLNKVMFTGRLGRDPDLKFTPQGSAVCTASVASSRAVRDESAENGWREETEWFRVVVWNDLAERFANALHKGDRVYIEGRLQTRDWTDQQGQKRTITEVIANDYIVLESRSNEAAANSGNEQADDGESFFVGSSSKNANQRGGGQGQSQPNNQRTNNTGKGQQQQSSRSTSYSANSQNRRGGSGGNSRYQAGYQDEQELDTGDIPF